MIPSWAKVGAKVVCVNIDLLPHLAPTQSRRDSLKLLALNNVYTVIAVGHSIHGRPCLWLKEMSSTWRWADGRTAGIALARFRPVHTLRSDIRMVKSLVREMPASERLDRVLELLNEPETP